MSKPYSIWSLAASLAFVLLITQADVFGQYNINTLISSGVDGVGVAADNAGYVYATGSNTSGPAILKINASGAAQVVVGTSSHYVFPCNTSGGPATNVWLTDLGGVAVDSSGNIYVSQSGNGPVYRDSGGTIMCLLPPAYPYFWGQGIVADNAGNVFFASTGDYSVYEITASGTKIRMAGNGLPGCTGAAITDPYGVALDSNGNLYIADWYCNVIWKVSVSSPGNVGIAAGTGSPGFFGDTGSALSAQLNEPRGIAIDADGNLYIADYGNNRIREVRGGIINTIAGAGAPGFSGDGGPALSAELDHPMGIAVAPNGNVYFGDNQRIRELIPTVATMTSPVPGSVLSSPSTTFKWTTVANVDQYRLEVGSTAGGNDYFDNLTTVTTQTSATVNSIPCDGRTVYVRLITKLSGFWLTPQSYTYTAASGCAMIVTPPNGTVLPSENVTFIWSGAPTGSEYQLDVSDRIGPIGQGDIFSNANILTTSIAVPNIPCDGRTIYVQLATLGTNGLWQNPGRYTYTACKMVTISVSPSSLSPQGGTVMITVTVVNLSQLTVPISIGLTESLYPPPPCMYNLWTHTWSCPKPIALASYMETSLPNGGIQLEYAAQIGKNLSAYGLQFLFNATVTDTSSGKVLDSAQAFVFEQ
jgi:sugar lactone lactonase YvrE